MRTQLESIYLPSFLPESGSHILGNLQAHAVRHLQRLSQYVRYNELTLGCTIAAVNLGCFALADKVLQFAPRSFEGLAERNPWAHRTSVAAVQGAVAGLGMTVVNKTLNLQVDPSLIAISIVASMALKHLWKQFLAPEAGSLLEEAKDGPASDIVPQSKTENPEQNASKGEERLDLVETDPVQGSPKPVEDIQDVEPKVSATGRDEDAEDAILDDLDKLKTPVEPTPVFERGQMTPSSKGVESMLETNRLDKFNANLRRYTQRV